MALTFDCVSVANGREPSGFAAFTGHSPDGSRRSANKVSAIWLTPNGQLVYLPQKFVTWFLVTSPPEFHNACATAEELSRRAFRHSLLHNEPKSLRNCLAHTLVESERIRRTRLLIR